MDGTLSRPSLSAALCFGTYPPPSNGGSDFLERLATHLAAAGVRPVVFTSPSPGEPMHATKDGITVHRVVADWRLGRGGARSARAVAGIADDEGIDVVQVFFPDPEIDAD
jgi:hypothetical protein